MTPCFNYLTPLLLWESSHRQYISKWGGGWLFSKKTLTTETGGRLIPDLYHCLCFTGEGTGSESLGGLCKVT